MSNIYIGDRIRIQREKQNYTRSAFAEKVGISPKFLYEIEMGKKGFSAEILCKIAKTLCVSCDFIMFGRETEQQGKENVMNDIALLTSVQTDKVQDILQMLYDLCESGNERRS